MDINNVPMVRVTWLDARDTETGWLDIKDVLAAPLAICQEVGWMVIKNDEKIWTYDIMYLEGEQKKSLLMFLSLEVIS